MALGYNDAVMRWAMPMTLKTLVSATVLFSFCRACNTVLSLPILQSLCPFLQSFIEMATPTKADALADRKGFPVQLRGSTLETYKKHTGAWYDVATEPTNEFYYIIIEQNDALECRRVMKENVWEAEQPPENYTDAAFQQYTDLKIALDKATMLMARCGIEGKGNKDLWYQVRKSLDANTRKVLKQGKKVRLHVNTSELAMPNFDMSSNHSKSTVGNGL